MSDFKQECGELIIKWRERSKDNKNKPMELEIHDGIAVGRERSAKELEQLLEEHKNE